MSRERWARFRWTMVVFAAISIMSLSKKGVFDEFSYATILIVLVSYAAVGFFAYLFWKKLPDDSRWLR